MANKKDDQSVDVNFESHPPIEEDQDGIAVLLRQTFLNFIDCNKLAKHLISLKDVTQVIALEDIDEENTSEEEDPDNDIYGTSSVVEIPNDKSKSNAQDVTQLLARFLEGRCPEFKKLYRSQDVCHKFGLIISERYINLPPQLALATLKNLSQHLSDSKFSHLVFVSKILLRSRSSNTNVASKKSKSGESSSQPSEPIIYINPEEEIIVENAEFQSDFDVSSYCDENATWSFNTDVKYTPHRRVAIVDFNKWQSIMKNLEEEIK